MRAAAPLHQIDRSALLVAVAERLGFKSTVGPGTVNRITRELLATRVYRLAEELAVGTGPRAACRAPPWLQAARAQGGGVTSSSQWHDV